MHVFKTWSLGLGILIGSALVGCSESEEDATSSGGDGNGSNTSDGGSGGSGDGDASSEGEQLQSVATTRLQECDLLSAGKLTTETVGTASGLCQLGCYEEATCDALETLVCNQDPTGIQDCVLDCLEEGWGATEPFECADGSEVRGSYRCDTEEDCEDGSDEADCEDVYFECDDGGLISPNYECDFEEDCADGSDETGCTNGFACDDGANIPEAFVCDGLFDCEDQSDEADCPEGPTFECGSGEVFPANYECDGEEDCEDASDEANCAEFQCD